MKPIYCPDCAAALRQESDTLYTCPNGHEYFNNPRACVAIVFWRDNQVLCSKRGIEPGKGKYDFPGGFLNYGEDPKAGAVREITEETSVRLQPADLYLVATYTGEYTPGLTTTDIVFLVTDWHGEFTPLDDSAALEWHSLDFLDGPASNVHYPGLADYITERLEHQL